MGLKKEFLKGLAKKFLPKPKVKLTKAPPKSGPKKKTKLKTKPPKAAPKAASKSGPKKKIKLKPKVGPKKPVKRGPGPKKKRRLGPGAIAGGLAAAALGTGAGLYLSQNKKPSDTGAKSQAKPTKPKLGSPHTYSGPQKKTKLKPIVKWGKDKNKVVRGGNGAVTWSGGNLTPQEIKKRRESRSHGGRIKYSRGKLVNRSHGGRISRSRGGLVNRRFITG